MKKSQKVNDKTYLQLITNFWAKQKEIKLSISAIGAYFALIDKAYNSSWEDVEISQSELCEELGLGSRHTLIKINNELVNAGLISITIRGGSNKTIYTIWR